MAVEGQGGKDIEAWKGGKWMQDISLKVIRTGTYLDV